MQEREAMEQLSQPFIDAAKLAAVDWLNNYAAEAKAKSLATDVFENAGEAVGSALKKGAKIVQEHPVESMLAGFGLGCLVGALLLRRD